MPVLARDRCSDRGAMDAVGGRESLVRDTSRSEYADRSDRTLVESSMMVRGAALVDVRRPDGTSLPRLVGHVVRLRPEEEVLRPNAWRVVAAMKDVKSRRDRPIGEFVGDTMSTAATLTVPHQKAVAAPRSRSLELQAFPYLNGSTPQSRRVVLRHRHERILACR